MRSTALRWSLAITLLFLSLNARAAIIQCNSGAVRRMVPCEIDGTLGGTNLPANPYTAVEVYATFTLPGESPVRVYGFLASGTTGYKFRFTPHVEGTWSYTFGTNSPWGITTPGGSFTVGFGEREYGFLRRDNVSFPERIVYDCNFYESCPTETTPFSSGGIVGFHHPFIWGQTYYQIINNAATKNAAGQKNTTWQGAITNSKFKGFRKIRMLVFPFNAEFNGAYKIGLDTMATPAAQSLPYITTSNCAPDYKRINTAHFDTLDEIVSFMYDRDMVAELILFHDQHFTHCGSSYSTVAEPEAIEDDKRYAKYVVARYAAYPTVIFSMGNEWETGPRNVTEFNMIAEAAKSYDPFRVHPETGLLRLMTTHGHERVIPTPGLAIATDSVNGWLVHSSLQWSYFAGNNRPKSPSKPDGWGEEVRLNNPARPSFDDEFGYLRDFVEGEAAKANPDPPRLEHRQAMWGLALAGVYGSVGDTLRVADPNGKMVDLTLRSEWLNRPEWNDFFFMAKFFADQNAQVPLSDWWLLRRDPAKSSFAERLWLASYPNEYLVLYDARGAARNANVSFTLPNWPNVVFEIYRYNVTTGAYVKRPNTQNPNTVFSYHSSEFGSATDGVFLIKAKSTIPGGG